MSGTGRTKRPIPSTGNFERRPRHGSPRDMSYEDPTKRRIGLPSMLQSRPRSMSMQARPRPAPPPPPRQPVAYRGPYVPFANRGPYVVEDTQIPRELHWPWRDDAGLSAASQNFGSLNQAPRPRGYYVPFANRGPYVDEYRAPRGLESPIILQSPELSSDSEVSLLPDFSGNSPIPGQFSDPDLPSAIGPGSWGHRESIGTQLQSTQPGLGIVSPSSSMAPALGDGLRTSSPPVTNPVAQREISDQQGPTRNQCSKNITPKIPPGARYILDRSGNIVVHYIGPPPGDDDPIHTIPTRPRSRSLAPSDLYNYPDFRRDSSKTERFNAFEMQSWANDLPRVDGGVEGFNVSDEYSEDEGDYDEDGSIVAETDTAVQGPRESPPINPNPPPGILAPSIDLTGAQGQSQARAAAVYRRPSNPDIIVDTRISAGTRLHVAPGLSTMASARFPESPGLAGLGISYVSTGTSALKLPPVSHTTVERPELPGSTNGRLRRPRIRHRIKHLGGRITSVISKMKRPE